jgi:hypothetical protein
MLVLTRKCQEAVVVGGANGDEAMLKVIVLGIEKGKVALALRPAAMSRYTAWKFGNEFARAFRAVDRRRA